jgi:hypothetical protein
MPDQQPRYFPVGIVRTVQKCNAKGNDYKSLLASKSSTVILNNTTTLFAFTQTSIPIELYHISFTHEVTIYSISDEKKHGTAEMFKGVYTSER